MTESQLKAITGNLSYEIVKPLFDKYEINTPQRQAGFLSQCAHESCDFKFKAENLNYSLNGLRKTFSKYFPTDDSAKPYARNPERIANKVYANRMGNGDEASGDGWKYRGRGYIQLTGKNNYEAFAKSINKTMDETITYLEKDDGALESALFYWQKAKCNSYCDKGDLKGLTRAINGGYNGLDDRTEKYNKYLAILQG